MNIVNNEKLSCLKIAAVFQRREVFELLKKDLEKITNKEDILFAAWRLDDLALAEEIVMAGVDVRVMVKYFNKDPFNISSLMSFIARLRNCSKRESVMLEFHQIPVRNLGNISLYQFIINQGHRFLRQREELIDHLKNFNVEKNEKPKDFKMLIIEDLKKNVPTSEGLAMSIRAVEEKFPWSKGKSICCMILSFIRKAFFL